MRQTILLLFAFSLMVLCACKKETTTNNNNIPTHQIVLSDIVDSLVGNYTGIDYQSMFGNGLIQYDTVYNAPITIAKFNDSVLVVNSYDTLLFRGSLAEKDYLFEWNYTSTYSNKRLWIDSNFNTIGFNRTTDNGGYGGTNSTLQVNR